MHLRKTLFQAGAQIEEILEGQVRMQSANDMKLGNSFAVSGSRCLKILIERHRISARSVFLASERTQPARRHAYVCGINMAVYVEVSFVAVHALADMVGHPSHGENIARAVEGQRV